MLGLTSEKLTPEQKMILETTQELVKQKIAPRAKEVDAVGEFPYDILDQYREQGFLRVMLPEEYGGIGADTTMMCLIIEEIAKACASSAISLVGHTTGTVAFLSSSTPKQRERFIGQDKDFFFAISISEPNIGSDVSGMSTKAVLQGDNYILNGRKCFVTNGGAANLYVVFARTGPERIDGISAFLVEKDTPGFSVGVKADKMGFRGSSTTELIFQNAVVPKENLLSAAGGFKNVMKTLEKMRVVVGSLALGIAEGALDYALGYVQERQQFGRPIGDFQGMRFMLADMATKVAVTRLLIYKAAEAFDQKLPSSNMYASMAKYWASDIAMEVTTNAVQCLGGYGYYKDYPVERMMRDAKAVQIFEGTNQIQRGIVAKEILKK